MTLAMGTSPSSVPELKPAENPQVGHQRKWLRKKIPPQSTMISELESIISVELSLLQNMGQYIQRVVRSHARVLVFAPEVRTLDLPRRRHCNLCPVTGTNFTQRPVDLQRRRFCPSIATQQRARP